MRGSGNMKCSGELRSVTREFWERSEKFRRVQGRRERFKRI